MESREWDAKHRRGKVYAMPQYTLVHQIQRMSTSWDFMPAGSTRPYANTTLSHLVEMAALLGMHWKSFKVASGDLSAEGNGCLFISSLVHGQGLVTRFSHPGGIDFPQNRPPPSTTISHTYHLHFTRNRPTLPTTFPHTGHPKFTHNRIIPSNAIKDWAFGFVPSILGLTLKVGRDAGVRPTLEAFRCNPQILDHFKHNKLTHIFSG
jgi:hypothetical protein